MGMSRTPKPNDFADHYPYEKWLFHWEYTLFSDKAICKLGVTVTASWSTHGPILDPRKQQC